MKKTVDGKTWSFCFKGVWWKPLWLLVEISINISSQLFSKRHSKLLHATKNVEEKFIGSFRPHVRSHSVGWNQEYAGCIPVKRCQTPVLKRFLLYLWLPAQFSSKPSKRSIRRKTGKKQPRPKWRNIKILNLNQEILKG